MLTPPLYTLPPAATFRTARHPPARRAAPNRRWCSRRTTNQRPDAGNLVGLGTGLQPDLGGRAVAEDGHRDDCQRHPGRRRGQAGTMTSTLCRPSVLCSISLTPLLQCGSHHAAPCVVLIGVLLTGLALLCPNWGCRSSHPGWREIPTRSRGRTAARIRRWGATPTFATAGSSNSRSVSSIIIKL